MHGKIRFEDDLDYSELSPRLVGVLKKSGFERMSDLYKMTDDQLLLLPNIGQHYLHQIRQAEKRSY
ncbi:DNA-directed RNA polymerase subunit alpha C-terminal domain-containing protein [Neorhizobium alkalisoli]|uniref:RNA polymerase alpha subunit n=1 Tax=Neorhizobium alkalisoli TaxID=528178 RepID=A0A561QHP1_9HYPH|nr:DNA-directed RNA polymerase subunit alpha C-terminal domain-containing protein [Neorhizobium alkalisoli]TWF49903.1 RNA polymerase alpha subunit [Neorhizobium alkalisoli]